MVPRHSRELSRVECVLLKLIPSLSQLFYYTHSPGRLEWGTSTVSRSVTEATIMRTDHYMMIHTREDARELGSLAECSAQVGSLGTAQAPNPHRFDLHWHTLHKCLSFADWPRHSIHTPQYGVTAVTRYCGGWDLWRMLAHASPPPQQLHTRPWHAVLTAIARPSCSPSKREAKCAHKNKQ